MLTRFLKLGGLAVIVIAQSTLSYAADRVQIDNFEYENFPIVRPNHDSEAYTYRLWGHDSDNNAGDQRPGRAVVEQGQAFQGNSSMASIVDSALNTFIQYYPYDEDSFQYRYLREQIELYAGTNDWKFDTYNRLRFWVKVDENQTVPPDQQTNFHFGTYYRSTTGKRKSAEDGGNHGYHYYNLEPTGEWHQVIVDFHPSHIRGRRGSQEHGVLEYPTGENGFNYFDLMTRFYVTFSTSLTSYPGQHNFDGFELYHDANPENITQVYSLSGVYVPASKEIIVAWKRDKDEDDLAHEVRYSYSSIHAAGWDSAKTLENSTVAPKGQAGYNGMKFKTTTDKFQEFNNPASVFIGIKPVNSSQFREIEIPIGSIIRPRTINSLSIE